MQTFRIEDLPQIQRWMADGLERGARAGIVSAAVRIIGNIQTVVIPAEPRMPVDRGIYRAGWQFEPTDDGADVYNATPQAPIIEDGARAGNIKPGRAMIDALTEWVKRKGIGTARAQTSATKVKKPIAVKAKPGVVKQLTKPIRAFITKLTKLIKGDAKLGGKGKKGSLSLGDAEARSLAWAIARSMQKKGIFNDGKGLGILRKALKNMPDIIEKEVAREIARAFR